jgi:hypothetical protein
MHSHRGTFFYLTKCRNAHHIHALFHGSFIDRNCIRSLANARVWVREKKYALYFSQSTLCVEFAFLFYLSFLISVIPKSL